MDDLLKEAALESFLFRPGEGGDATGSSSESDTNPSDEGEEKTAASQELPYFEDRGTATSTPEKEDKEDEWKPVWEDDADETIVPSHTKQGKHVRRVLTQMAAPSLKVAEYEQQLRRMHQDVHPHTEWASLRSKKRKSEETEDEDETEKLLSNATPLVAQTRALPKGRIEVISVMDANVHDPYRSKLASIGYSDGGELFMTATRNGRVSLFHVDGEQNPLVDAIGIKSFTIIEAAFLPRREKILAIGSPQFQSIQLLDLESKEAERIYAQDSIELFHSFSAASTQDPTASDLVAFVGKGGSVPIYSFNSRQWISKLQSNRPIESATFVGATLYTCGAGGNVQIWDMRTFRCHAEFTDPGTLHSTSLAVCPHQEYMATGSDSGVVNLYRAKDCSISSVSTSPPMPIKTLFNLKTEIDTITFHPASQVLAKTDLYQTEDDMLDADDGDGFDAYALCHEAGASAQLCCFCQLAQSASQQDARKMRCVLSPRRFDACGFLVRPHLELPSLTLRILTWHHLRPPQPLLDVVRDDFRRMLSILRSSGRRWATRVASCTAPRWFATQSESESYTSQMRFASLVDAEPIPVFRTLSDAGASLQDAPQDVAFSKEFALRIYEVMLRLHVADTLFYEAQRQGRISFYLTSFGEEATTVGSAAALETSDEAFLQYRELGFLLWRGFTLRQMADQCFGNALECGKGRQMPIHYGSPELHVHTISSVLATQVPHAVGAAFALKAEGKPNVAVAFFGEGAASEGDFHAALNFAATLELPVLFICRNNGYAISTPSSQQFKPYCVGVRGPSYGIQTIRVDGGDPRAVYLAVKESRQRAVEQKCPILIEAMCYRGGHHSTSDDSTRYRQESEQHAWRAREPMGRFFQFLSQNGWWSAEENDKLKDDIRHEVISALDAAEKVPKAPVAELFTDVYASMPWHLREQHQDLLNFLKVHPEQRPKDIPLS